MEINTADWNNVVDEADICIFNGVLERAIYLNLLEELDIVNKLLVILYTTISINRQPISLYVDFLAKSLIVDILYNS